MQTSHVKNESARMVRFARNPLDNYGIWLLIGGILMAAVCFSGLMIDDLDSPSEEEYQQVPRD